LGSRITEKGLFHSPDRPKQKAIRVEDREEKNVSRGPETRASYGPFAGYVKTMALKKLSKTMRCNEKERDKERRVGAKTGPKESAVPVSKGTALLMCPAEH